MRNLKSPRLLLIGWILVLGFFFAFKVWQDPVRTYLSASVNDIAQSAEVLKELTEEGKLTEKDAAQIVAVLEPRLMKRGKHTADKRLFAEEIQLAWSLIASDLTQPGQKERMVQALVPSWCEYLKKNDNRAARIELHGGWIWPKAGLLLHQRLWFVSDGEEKQLALEGFICNDDRSCVGINWGLEDFTSKDAEDGEEFRVLKESVLYRIPVSVAEHLPVREDDIENFDSYQEVIDHPKAERLCSYQQTVVLSEEKGWQSDF